MKAGYTNLIASGTATGGTNPSNVLDADSLLVGTLAAGETITITFTKTNFDFLALFNYDGSCLDVKIYGEDEDENIGENGFIYDTFIYDAELAYTGKTPYLNFHSKTFLSDDASGFEYSNYFIDNLSNAIFDKIEITNCGSTTAYLGYVWAGDWIDFGCAEAISPVDESSDNVTINRANRPIPEERYLFQSFQVTTIKTTEINTLRSKVRQILVTGFASPRPWLISEIYSTPEIMYGILESGKVGYNIYEIDTTKKSNITIGVREVT